jgi:hypothetical protein
LLATNLTDPSVSIVDRIRINRLDNRGVSLYCFSSFITNLLLTAKLYSATRFTAFCSLRYGSDFCTAIDAGKRVDYPWLGISITTRLTVHMPRQPLSTVITVRGNGTSGAYAAAIHLTVGADEVFAARLTLSTPADHESYAPSP